MRKLFLLIPVLVFTLITHAQTTYFSKSGSTNFNDINSWGTASDGTGSKPASISNADIFVIGNGCSMTMNSPAVVQSLYIGNFTGFVPASATGSLLIAAGNSLTVSKAMGNNARLAIGDNGILAINAGSLLVKGNIAQIGTGYINQQGGTIEVDGNDAGNIVTSVASGTPIVNLVSTNNTFEKGVFTITDPHAGVAETDAALAFIGTNNSTLINSAVTHTFQFGNGISTDPGGNSKNGFFIYHPYNHRFNLGSVIINTVVNSNNRFVSNGMSYYLLIIRGNLTITSGEYIIPADNGLTIAGNIENNGTLTSIGVLLFGSLSNTGEPISAFNAQSVSGNGIFRNTVVEPSANFTRIQVDNTNNTGIQFSGTGWNSLPVTVSKELSLKNGKINIGAAGVFTFPADFYINYTSGGFVNGTIKRICSTGKLSLGTGSLFPFINSANKKRQFFIGFPYTLESGGSVSITYTEEAGVNVVPAFTDFGANITKVSNDSWAISQSGLAPSYTTIQLRIFADGIITHSTPSARITAATGSVFGEATSDLSTPQKASGTPYANKTTTTVADITAVPTKLYVGFSKLYKPASNGNWENASTWEGGASPGLSCDDVLIDGNFTVTVNSSNASCQYLECKSGTLNVNGAMLTVGCINNNNRVFLNQGTLNVNGGILKINGNLNTSSLSSTGLFQTGGEIVIDGNNGIMPRGSVPTLIPLFGLYTENATFTGGKIVFVDPHIVESYFTYAFDYEVRGSDVIASNAHTVQFGDGVSKDEGALYGFLIKSNSSSGSNHFRFGNLVVHTGNGIGRFVKNYNHTQVNGDFTIIDGKFINDKKFSIAGNVINNGTLINSGEFNLQDGGEAVKTAQTIGGNGVFANEVIGDNANFERLTVNNSSAGGVTLNVPLSVRSQLNLFNGIINTSNTNLLTLGPSDATRGTLNYSGGRINGPFKRAITDQTGERQFPVGTKDLLKNATIDYSTAPTTAGFLTAEWIQTDPGMNGLPLTEGAINVTQVSPLGFWRMVASGGLDGGTYTGTFSPEGTPGINSVDQLVLLKRSNASSPWVLNGTHITGAGTNINPIIARSGMSGFSEFGIGSGSANSLPLNLLSFNAKTQSKNAILQWRTANELNTSKFEIQRSDDGHLFSSVGTVLSGGNNYSWTDAGIFNNKQIIYYRLKSIDNDGAFTYSNIIRLSGSLDLPITVYPNPVKDILTISGLKESSTIHLFDPAGKLLQQIKVNSTTITIDMKSYANGIYMIRYDEGAKVMSQKIIKE